MISVAGVSMPPMPVLGKPVMNYPLTTLMQAEMAIPVMATGIAARCGAMHGRARKAPGPENGAAELNAVSHGLY